MKRGLIRFAIMLGVVIAGAVGYGAPEALVGQAGACPTEDACYRANCDEACKTNFCTPGSCPDPGELGERCYVCANPE